MAAPYYTHASGLPQDQTRALAAQMRDELDAIAASFNLLPIPSAIVGGYANYGVDSGIANAYAVAVGPAITSYVDGLTVRFKATNANTGASTINVNGLGIRSIVRPDGTSLAADDIYAGQISQLSYNATTSQFQLALTPLAAVYQALGYANAAAASASAASGSASSAAGSASSASTSMGLAMQWAISLSLVDGTYFGARKYAIDAANTFNGTSTTSLTVGLGSKSFATQAGKAWVVGQRVTVARTSDPSTVMFAYVNTYDIATGAANVIVDKFNGSGTYTDWTISIGGSNGASGTLTFVPVTNATTVVVAAGNFYCLRVAGANLSVPVLAAGSKWGFGVSGGSIAYSINWNSEKLKGRSPGVMTGSGQNDTATVVLANATDGYMETA